MNEVVIPPPRQRAWDEPRPWDTPDHVAIRKSFARLRRGPVVPDDRVVGSLAYLPRLIRAANSSKDLTHGEDHQSLRTAVRTLLQVLPGMVERAGAETTAARREGRTTDMAFFQPHAQALLDAAKPFAAVAQGGRRDRRGWWHGWARLIVREVRLVLWRHHGRFAGVGKPTSPAVVVTRDLLALCGVDKDAEAVMDALQDPTPRGVIKRKVPRLQATGNGR